MKILSTFTVELKDIFVHTMKVNIRPQHPSKYVILCSPKHNNAGLEQHEVKQRMTIFGFG